MATINFTVEDHSIRVDNLIELAQGSNNFDTCAFSFDSTWDGFVLYAVMYQNPKNVFKLPLDAENTRKIPQEVLQKDGWVYIGARGEKEDTDETIATSMVVRLPVRKGAVNGNETGQEILNESQYEYLLGKVNELNEKCESLTKELEEDIGQLSEEIDELKENNTESGSGLSDTAKTLLITILRECATKTDQTANITALETALASSGGSSGGVTTYSIINSLTNVTSDNSATLIIAEQGYTATLTPSEGYVLESVTVTMGGVDVTGEVYADGVIAISSVTGDILITATAIESASAIVGWLYHFDNNLYASGEKDFGFTVKNATYDTASMGYIDGKFGKTFRGYCTIPNSSQDSHILYATDLTEYPVLDGDFTIAFWGRNSRNATKATYLSTITSNAWGYGATTPTPTLVDKDNWTLNANSGRKPYGFWIDWATGLRVHMVDSTDTFGMCYVVTPTDASVWDTETWHHYAVTRSGSTIMLFIDGKMIWNVEFDGEIAFGNRIGLCCIWNSSGTLSNGEFCDLDELLIDDETCRYTENFDVPTAPYVG